MSQETKAQEMTLDNDNWREDFEKQVERHLAGEDKNTVDAVAANESEIGSNTPSSGTSAYLSDTMKILQRNPDGGTIEELCKSLEAKLVSMSSTKITEKGTRVKAQLAPRMTCWGEGQKRASAEAKIVHHLWASFWGTVKGEHSALRILGHLHFLLLIIGNYLNSVVCDLLHGDVAPANMFWYLDNEGKAVGVLNDFDHHDLTKTEYYGIKLNHEAKPEDTK